MSASTRTVRWRTDLGDGSIGLEHVEIRIGETGITAEGVSVGGTGEGWGARWRITVDPDWTSVRSLHLTRLGGPTVALRHDGYGEWSDGEGKKRKEFAGLTDCLVEGSPFGIGALFSRLGKKADKAQTVDVVAVSLPGLEATRVAAALKPLGGRRWAVTLGAVEGEVELDEEGGVRRWGPRTRVETGAVAA